MKELYLTVVGVFWFCSAVLAQGKIVFSNTFDLQGNPLSNKDTWYINSVTGGFVHILYFPEKPINQPKMYLFVDKKNKNGDYVEYKTEKFSNPEGKTRLAVKFDFFEVGEYKIGFANALKKVLDSAEIEIEIGNKLAFSQELTEYNQPKKPGNKFKLNPDNAYVVYAFYKDSEPIESEKVSIKIFQKHKGDDILYYEKSYKINPDWHTTFFKFFLLKRGTYQVQILDDDDDVIAENELLIE